MNLIKKQLSEVLSGTIRTAVNPDDFVLPPKNIDADLALPCFDLAKRLKKNPLEIAREIACFKFASCKRNIQ